jgi:hypothetical protein
MTEILSLLCANVFLNDMKTFIVYLKGVEVGYIKAANHNAAEKKAFQKYNGDCRTISVAYTEL